jgi:HD-GYP domain-containing protein (c-di-GMP phosphodiesterase class II)/predicted hydrocarbon binding protein
MAAQHRNRPLYSSRIVDTYIRLIKIKYSYINIRELLQAAGMETYQVEDEGHWFTQEQINRFHDRVQKLTANKNIAYEAGRHAASPDALGFMRPYILGLIGPAKAYELVGKYAGKFSRSSSYVSQKTAPDKIEITVKPHEGVVEEPFQCENRKGYFEAIAMAFGHKVPYIEHTKCIFKGDSECHYVVNLPESPAARWKSVRDYFAVSSMIFCLVSTFLFPKLALAFLVPFFFSIIMLLTLYAGRIEIRSLHKAIENLRGASDEVLEHISRNYENALMLNELGQVLGKESEISGILEEVVEILQERLDYDRGLILLANEEKTRLIFQVGFGYSDEQMSSLTKRVMFHLDKEESKGVFVLSFREQRPFLVNDIAEIEKSLTARSLDFVRKLGVKSFICLPIVYEGESLGILAVDNMRTKRPLVQRDMNLLMGVAPQIGISIHNVRLIEARQRQFNSFMQVLADTIDARDPITAGHSEKVTEYTQGICAELGVSEDYTEMVRVASLLHDYGKVGVKDSVLKKPGRLTPEEREEIKTHVIKTKTILERINFEGVYRDVPHIAGSHHEKIDGSGYPLGLKDEEIPLGAKILAVADVFEAITSKRHYRDPMTIEDAFRHMRQDVGHHFDEECVEALYRYISTTRDEEWDRKFLQSG